MKKSRFHRNSEVAIDISKRRRAGETLASIGRSYNVTREYIRQLCTEWGVKPEYQRPSDDTLAKNAFSLLNNGQALTIEEAAKSLGIELHQLYRAAKNTNIDLRKAILNFRSHLHDGKRFGNWEVIPGSYRRIHVPNTKEKVQLLDCRCACGTERTVRYVHLRKGYSCSCGCLGKRPTAWLCSETNEREESNTCLARRLGISQMEIGGKRNTGQPVVDANGHTWNPVMKNLSPVA